MSESFARLYEHWFYDEPRKNDSLKPILASGYRKAWETGSKEDRYAVLNLIYELKLMEAYDIVLVGLTESDVASHAASMALSLITEGEDLGQGIRAALQDFERDVPDWAIFATVALEVLNEREAQHDAGQTS